MNVEYIKKKYVKYPIEKCIYLYIRFCLSKFINKLSVHIYSSTKMRTQNNTFFYLFKIYFTLLAIEKNILKSNMFIIHGICFLKNICKIIILNLENIYYF